MNFWENVDLLRDYKNLTRKELAYKADFSLNSISTGIARNSIPAADVAYRIAKTLGVSVEYLLTGSKSSSAKNEAKLNDLISKDIELFSEYHSLLEQLNNLDEKSRATILYLIESLNEKKKNPCPQK